MSNYMYELTLSMINSCFSSWLIKLITTDIISHRISWYSQFSIYWDSDLNFVWSRYIYHRLTLIKGLYSFRYFLSPMRIPNLLMHVFIMLNPFVIWSCIYAYIHEQTPKGFGKMNICITRFGIRIGDRKYLNEYTPFGSVNLWYMYMHQQWLISMSF